jgi:uncharacterized protein YbaR (Trm112 family)
MSGLAPRLLARLACPMTKQPLVLRAMPGGGSELLSPALGVAFPVRADGVPVLDPREGRVLGPGEADPRGGDVTAAAAVKDV